MGELAKIDSFKRELALAETIEQIKLLGDVAQAYQFIMKRQGINKNKIDEIGEFDLEVEYKKADWLNEFYPSRVRGDAKKLSDRKTQPDMPVTREESTKSRKIKKFIDDNPDNFKQLKEEIKNSKENLNTKSFYKELSKKERKEKIQKQKEEIKKGLKNPSGLFSIIIMDPPWNYNYETYNPYTNRGVINYPTLTQKQLLNIKLPAEDNCILWLWTTHAFIWDAKELMDHWGFQYKCILTWDKEKIGIGRWLRLQTEFCLLGIKGKPIWDISDMRDIIREARREHSRKPDMFYELIEKNFVGRKLDYFGRKKRKGFELYGDETNKF